MASLTGVRVLRRRRARPGAGGARGLSAQRAGLGRDEARGVPAPASVLLQRQCAECAAEEGTASRQADEKEDAHASREAEDKAEDKEEAHASREAEGEEEEARAMREQQTGGAGPPRGASSSVSAQLRAARGAGRALDGQTLRFMQARLGHDLSQARVHTDARADTLSRRLAARAFTSGADIYFRSGAYDPASRDGLRLLAHELTHVVQQRGDRVLRVQPNTTAAVKEDRRADLAALCDAYFRRMKAERKGEPDVAAPPSKANALRRED